MPSKVIEETKVRKVNSLDCVNGRENILLSELQQSTDMNTRLLRSGSSSSKFGVLGGAQSTLCCMPA